MPFATIPEALADLKQGKFVTVLDDEDRKMKVINFTTN